MKHRDQIHRPETGNGLIGRMKAPLIALFLSFSGICSGDTLNVSELADTEGEDARRIVLQSDEEEEVFFVKKEPLLGDADIEHAWLVRSSGGRISVKLNEKGAAKLHEATKKMRLGHDRLAFLVEGRLISAPVVQSVLGASFEIAGLEDLDARQLDDLARKMAGEPSPADEEPPPANTLPKTGTIPFTEEEYQRNKATREKMGIFRIESVPTEEELDGILRKGMSHAGVLKAFGKPSTRWENPAGDGFDLMYEIAPEKRPENPEREVYANGFKVDFDESGVKGWSHTYSNAPREEKMVEQEPALLQATLPEIDFSTGDIDFVAFVEGIVIPDPRQEVRDRDLSDLITIARMPLDDAEKERPLDADCDFMKILAHHFPEIASIKKRAADGKVTLKALSDALSPYAEGVKPFPRGN